MRIVHRGSMCAAHSGGVAISPPGLLRLVPNLGGSGDG
jgi:hypothetical protein